jgi:hypothetical protein
MASCLVADFVVEEVSPSTDLDEISTDNLAARAEKLCKRAGISTDNLAAIAEK